MPMPAKTLVRRHLRGNHGRVFTQPGPNAVAELCLAGTASSANQVSADAPPRHCEFSLCEGFPMPARRLRGRESWRRRWKPFKKANLTRNRETTHPSRTCSPTISGQRLETTSRPKPQRSRIRSIYADMYSQRTSVMCKLKPRLHEHCALTLVLLPGQQIKMHMRWEFTRNVRWRPLGVMNYSPALLVWRPIAGCFSRIRILRS